MRSWRSSGLSRLKGVVSSFVVKRVSVEKCDDMSAAGRHVRARREGAEIAGNASVGSVTRQPAAEKGHRVSALPCEGKAASPEFWVLYAHE